MQLLDDGPRDIPLHSRHTRTVSTQQWRETLPGYVILDKIPFLRLLGKLLNWIFTFFGLLPKKWPIPLDLAFDHVRSRALLISGVSLGVLTAYNVSLGTSPIYETAIGLLAIPLLA